MVWMLVRECHMIIPDPVVCFSCSSLTLSSVLCGRPCKASGASRLFAGDGCYFEEWFGRQTTVNYYYCVPFHVQLVVP